MHPCTTGMGALARGERGVRTEQQRARGARRRCERDVHSVRQRLLAALPEQVARVRRLHDAVPQRLRGCRVLELDEVAGAGVEQLGVKAVVEAARDEVARRGSDGDDEALPADAAVFGKPLLNRSQ